MGRFVRRRERRVSRLVGDPEGPRRGGNRVSLTTGKPPDGEEDSEEGEPIDADHRGPEGREGCRVEDCAREARAKPAPEEHRSSESRRDSPRAVEPDRHAVEHGQGDEEEEALVRVVADPLDHVGELTWLQEHTTQFEDGGLSFTSLVRALVNDPKYRSIR